LTRNCPTKILCAFTALHLLPIRPAHFSLANVFPSNTSWPLKSKSKSKLYLDRQSVGQSVLVSGTHLGPATNFSYSLLDFFCTVSVFLCGVPSLMRRRVCTFQFLPEIASADFLRSQSHETHEYILLSLFLRLSQPGGPG
jgi:hypothetical protein